jgi:hypothetical protein
MSKSFFDKTKQFTISNWSLSSFLIGKTDITNFPQDWKWVFRGYITSLEYVGVMGYDEDDREYEDWSMSSSSPAV